MILEVLKKLFQKKQYESTRFGEEIDSVLTGVSARQVLGLRRSFHQLSSATERSMFMERVFPEWNDATSTTIIH